MCDCKAQVCISSETVKLEDPFIAGNRHKWLWIPTGIACAAALYAAIGHPSEYGFYVLARIAVTLASAILAYYLAGAKREGLCIACIATAVIFNPFIPFPLGRSIWMVLDLVVVVLLIVGTLSVLDTTPGSDTENGQ